MKLGASPVEAVRVFIAMCFIVGAVSAALWCSLFTRGAGILLGTVGYLYGPYYLTLPYVRGAYPEFFAMSLAPLAFYLAHRSVQLGGWKSSLGTAIVMAVIVSSHTLSLILILPLLILYWIAVSMVMEGRPRLIRLSLVLLLFSMLASPYVIGPLFETGRVEVSRQFQSADLYRSAGIPWYCFFNRNTALDVASHLRPGRVHLLCLVTSLLLVICDRRRRDELALIHLSLAFFGLCLSETSIASAAVSAFPPLRYLQFPWRNLGIFNLFCASSLAISLTRISFKERGAWKAIGAAFPALCFALYFPTIPTQTAVAFENKTRDGIRSSLTTLDHEDKYIPLGAKRFDTEAPPVWKLLQAEEPGVWIDLMDLSFNDYTFGTSSIKSVKAIFHQYWYPGWRALLDGQELPLTKDEAEGLIRLEIPEGAHRIRIFFGNSRLRAVGGLLSWLAAGGVLCWLCLGGLRRLLKRPATACGRKR